MLARRVHANVRDARPAQHRLDVHERPAARRTAVPDTFTPDLLLLLAQPIERIRSAEERQVDHRPQELGDGPILDPAVVTASSMIGAPQQEHDRQQHELDDRERVLRLEAGDGSLPEIQRRGRRA